MHVQKEKYTEPLVVKHDALQKVTGLDTVKSGEKNWEEKDCADTCPA